MHTALFLKSVLFSAIFTLFAVSLHAADTLPPLRVGMELAYPPFEMTDKSGNPTGISVDLANDLGKALGRRIIIENMAFDGLIPALKTGKIDIIISSMTATPERAVSVDFSDPYLKTGLCLLVRKGAAARRVADLDAGGINVAVKKGTTGHIYAVKNLKKANLLVLDRESAAVMEVVQGKADAFIYDQMSIYRNWMRNRGTTRALLEPFQQESWCVAIRKGNVELKNSINAFLSDYRKKGGLDVLGDRYLKEMKNEFRALGLSFIF